jgi:hypothetical protein
VRKQLRDIINQPKRHQHSRRQRTFVPNAFKHGLSGDHLVLQNHELASYLLNFDMTANEPDFEEDEGIAWKKDARSFEILGRCEARLSRQLLQYQRCSNPSRRVHAASVALSQTKETAALNHELASFGKPAPMYLMSAHPAPQIHA